MIQILIKFANFGSPKPRNKFDADGLAKFYFFLFSLFCAFSVSNFCFKILKISRIVYHGVIVAGRLHEAVC
nr:hypothetical protein [uncultured Campylobacter sp.]